jgi:hypothetical protein
MGVISFRKESRQKMYAWHNNSGKLALLKSVGFELANAPVQTDELLEKLTIGLASEVIPCISYKPCSQQPATLQYRISSIPRVPV